MEILTAECDDTGKIKMEKTPKDLFLDKVSKTVEDFERETGVEVHHIEFGGRIRIDNMDERQKTIHTNIELILR